MRIFLLPISTRQALVYCQRLTQKPSAQLSIADKITKKATETWAKWEAADRGWQKKVVEYGNRGLQRIPYQEWGLKSFPPSNPDIQAEQLTAGKKFDVIYPKNVMDSEDVPKVLSRLAHERKHLHYKRFVGSLVALPFTIPFALVPVVPNIPFFYMAYRAWSHWRAMKGSDHLDFILDHKLFRPISNEHVEEVYKNVGPKLLHSFRFVTRKQLEEGEVPDEKLLLSSGSHTMVAKSLDVPELSAEVERAVWQIQTAIEKGEQAEKESGQQAPARRAKTDQQSGRKDD